MDIRLKTLPFEYNGKTYQLRCNFNVLADLQEEFGEIPNIFSRKKMLKSVPVLLASMMNDYADEMEWPERFTAKQIGRTLDIKDTELINAVTELLVSAVCIPKTEENNDPKN